MAERTYPGVLIQDGATGGSRVIPGIGVVYSEVGAELDERYARPNADLAAGSWLPSAGSDLWDMLDEEAYSDSDYIYVDSASSCEVSLSGVVDPESSGGHVLRVRARSIQESTLVVTLKQGGTTIATRTFEDLFGWATYNVTLTQSEADSITDYTDLSVVLEAQAGGE